MFNKIKTDFEILYGYFQMSDAERAYLLWRMWRTTCSNVLNNPEYGHEYQRRLAKKLNWAYNNYKAYIS